ncbi:DUF932 domain-containing protein [Photobacterium kagoshimensis]|uniref:DUF932 domain-containing protein n=1 Tax=Photobacterium kagoshimensis TaxID=2910242 RepID=UPI003D13044B
MTKKLKTVDIRPAYFPVEFRGIGLKIESEKNKYQQINDFKAVIDTESGKIFTIVTNGYNLITNKEAVDQAKPIFERVFSGIQFSDMKVFNIVMPKTRSYCHIDLVHDSSNFECFNQDSWTPFLRVTNSYNKTKKLSYEIGFCRHICMNGVIFGSKSVEISFTHNHGATEIRSKFIENFDDIAKLQTQFIGQLKQIKKYYVPKDKMLALTCKVFKQKKPMADDTGKMKVWQAFQKETQRLTECYFDELGQNGYAALNVLTDLASSPKGMLRENHTHSYQTTCGNWISDFTAAIKEDDFEFDEYLEEFNRYQFTDTHSQTSKGQQRLF